MHKTKALLRVVFVALFTLYILWVLSLHARAFGSTDVKVRSKPYVVSDIQGEDRCQIDEGLGACYDRKITVKNPLKYPVWVRLDCGPEFFSTDAQAYIMPKESVIVVIGTQGHVGGLNKNQCKIVEWKVWK